MPDPLTAQRHGRTNLPAPGPPGRIWHRQAHGWWPTRIGIALAALLPLTPLLVPALLDASLSGSVSKRMGAARLMLATPHPGLAFPETLAHVRDDTRCQAEVGGSVVYANPGCWLPAHEQATGCPRPVWCARQGDRYGRIRVLEYRGEAGCRAPFRS